MKKIRWGVLSLCALIIALALSGCGGGGTKEPAKETAKETSGSTTPAPAAEAKSYKLKVGFNTVEGSVRDISAKAFKKYVEEKSSGRITVEIFPGEALGTEQEMIEAVKAGALEIQLCGGSGFQNVVPEFAASTLPFLFSNYDEAHALFDGAWGDKLKKLAEAKGFQVLTFLDLGFAQVTNNKRPITKPEDFDGVKMRSPNEPTSIETFKALGASVSTLPFSELYMALSQKVVDGQFNPLDAIHDSKFYEAQDYLTITNHFFYSINFMMNKALWDSMDADTKKIIQEGANVARDTSREFFKAKDAEMMEKLKPHFKEITTNPDLEAFRAKVMPLYETTFTKIVPKASLDEMMAEIEKIKKK